MGRVLDVNVIEAAKNGDSKAMRSLIESTQSRLYRFCLVMCGDPVRAEDLSQEAYLKVFNKLSQLNKYESFMDWLFRMTRNLYIDQLRRTKEQASEITEEDLINPAQPGLEESLAVHQVLSNFQPEDRALLVLVDMEGYSYQEAASHFEISEDTVRSRLFRLRKDFLKMWKNRETK